MDVQCRMESQQEWTLNIFFWTWLSQVLVPRECWLPPICGHKFIITSWLSARSQVSGGNPSWGDFPPAHSVASSNVHLFYVCHNTCVPTGELYSWAPAFQPCSQSTIVSCFHLSLVVIKKLLHCPWSNFSFSSADHFAPLSTFLPLPHYHV